MAQLWFKWWAKEYLSDAKVRCLSYEARGILQTLWSFAWEEGFIPACPETLGRMLGINAKAMRSHSEWIAIFFHPHPNDASKLISPRLELERMEADAKGSKARESARQRWEKAERNHANALRTDMRTQCEQVCESHAGQGQGTERESTPLPPASGGTRGRKRLDSGKGFEAIPEEVLELARAIRAETPAEDHDGRPIRFDPAKLVDRLDAILKSNQSVTAPLLLESWKAYRATKPKAIKAPQYFYGEQKDNGDGANWRYFARLLWTKRQGVSA